MARTTLGLDLGTNSMGWALIEENSAGEPISLVACGSRIFQEAVEAKTKTPKNQARRLARAARRLTARRKMRKQSLCNILVHAELLPNDRTQRENILTKLDPYFLRLKALDQKLEKYEFGRILYHLCQRRGFKSNRKAIKKNSEDGKIKQSINELQKEIDSSGNRTLGEYLFHQPKKRNRYTDRSMFEYELEQIWTKQQHYYPDVLMDALRAKVYKAIFFRNRTRIVILSMIQE